MTVIVTGAAGFIGMHVADALLARGETASRIRDRLNGFLRPEQHDYFDALATFGEAPFIATGRQSRLAQPRRADVGSRAAGSPELRVARASLVRKRAAGWVRPTTGASLDQARSTARSVRSTGGRRVSRTAR